MTSPCCSAGEAGTRTRRRPPPAERRIRSPTRGGGRAPGSRANMPTSRRAGRAGSPFANDAWERLYVSGYAGHAAQTVKPAAGSRVLADLVELTGDLTDATTAIATIRGPAIVLTERTAYVANQVFELIGGMLQAHLNVEAVRHWANPTHWGDTLLFFLRWLLREVEQQRVAPVRGIRPV